MTSISTIDDHKQKTQECTNSSFLGALQKNSQYTKQTNPVSNNSSQVVIMTQTQQSRSPSIKSSVLDFNPTHQGKPTQKTMETKIS